MSRARVNGDSTLVRCCHDVGSQVREGSCRDHWSHRTYTSMLVDQTVSLIQQLLVELLPNLIEGDRPEITWGGSEVIVELNVSLHIPQMLHAIIGRQECTVVIG